MKQNANIFVSFSHFSIVTVRNSIPTSSNWDVYRINTYYHVLLAYAITISFSISSTSWRSKGIYLKSILSASYPQLQRKVYRCEKMGKREDQWALAGKKATGGRFLNVHPLGGGHVAVAALYSHGWHVAWLRYPRIPLHNHELHHLLLLGSRCPRGFVALFNILIVERSVCVSFRASGGRTVGVAHVLAIAPFWLISVRIDWHERGWCSTKESSGTSFGEGRERDGEKEKKIATAGTKDENRRRTHNATSIQGLKSPHDPSPFAVDLLTRSNQHTTRTRSSPCINIIADHLHPRGGISLMTTRPQNAVLALRIIRPPLFTEQGKRIIGKRLAWEYELIFLLGSTTVIKR